MLTYTYDGSFEGLMTAVFYAFSHKETPDMVTAGRALQIGFTDVCRDIPTDKAKAVRVQRGICNTLGRETLENVYKAFLTTCEDKDITVFNYLALGFRIGPKVRSRFSHPVVMRMEILNKKVETEVQHLKGFIRFRMAGSAYYAKFAPDNDVLELLAPHFAERFSDQHFIIHDVRRHKMVLSMEGQWLMLQDDKDIEIPDAGPDETQYAELWKAFHKALAIKERVNLRQQRGMMPRRYWKYMLEMGGACSSTAGRGQ